MQASIMPSRLNSVPMLVPMPPMCHSAKSAASAADLDLLSQCTTEWSRSFIVRIASSGTGKYTAALTADLSPQPHHQTEPASPHSCTATPQSPKQQLLPDSSASSTSSLTSSGGADSPDSRSSGASPSLLRRAATSGERSSRRRVQFADEVGQMLTRVKLLSEPSEPLPLDQEICSDSDTQQQSDSGGLQLKCKFSQPCAKYIVFRESVERHLVCLSLVHLDFNTIRGAIAVKNVSFHKRVFARITLDSWCSFRDVDAAYNWSDGQQDNFAFSAQCPSDQLADVQFCVCFECDLGVFWDSNGGDNYHIEVSRSPPSGATSSSYTRDFKPNYCGITDYSQFSAWEHFTDRVYY